MSVISTRTLFLSSEDNSNGDSRVLQMNIPTQLTNYRAQTKLRLTLNTFSCAKTWYSINETNGIFYVGNTVANTLTEVQIPYANYTDLDQLTSLLQTSIKNAIVNYAGNVTVLYNNSGDGIDYKNKFRITLDPAVPNIKFVSFSVSGDFFALPGSNLQKALESVSTAGKYNDSDQVLGGRVNRSTAGLAEISQLSDLFGITTPNSVFQSVYPCNIQTNDALYLRITSLPTHNIESTNLSTFTNSNEMISSDIWAKILLPSDTTTDFIRYIDPNDNFVIEVSGSQFISFRITLTDSKARLITLASPTQASDGSINYSLSIKVEELAPVGLPDIL